MHIHTVKTGDTIFKIARQYSVSPMKIIENNGLSTPDMLSVGQKLLILTPTRTYNAASNDNLDKIAKRFAVSKKMLKRLNPSLFGSDSTYPGQLITVKRDAAPYGLGFALGFCYKRTGEEKFSQILPFLDYVAISEYMRSNNKTVRVFDGSRARNAAIAEGVIPLLRIFDKENSFSEKYAEELLKICIEQGYSGIVMAAYKNETNGEDEYSLFLRYLKSILSAEGLILFSETDGNRHISNASIADGYIILYEKCNLENIPSFKDGEEKLLRSFAENFESRRAFLDISSLAFSGKDTLSHSQANETARLCGSNILYDDDKKICYYNFNRYKAGEREKILCAYSPLENLKAKLDLIGELGFMGISIDIDRVQTEEIMMFREMFDSRNN